MPPHVEATQEKYRLLLSLISQITPQSCVNNPIPRMPLKCAMDRSDSTTLLQGFWGGGLSGKGGCDNMNRDRDGRFARQHDIRELNWAPESTAVDKGHALTDGMPLWPDFLRERG